MSWLKDANKIGSYERSYRGFRLYWKKKPQVHTQIVERNGERWRQTDLIKGDLVAIDKSGCRLEDHYVDALAYKIDIELLSRHFDKKDEKLFRKNR